MKSVNRDAVAEPKVLKNAKGRGKKELGRAIEQADELLGSSERDLAEFKLNFNAYRQPEVRKALDKLFDGKCAYCEKRYAGTQPMDVEHWRPKGKALRDGTDDMKPGYYWLAAKWENLLPSCIDCNRARKQNVPYQDEPVLLGKANQFPVADEKKRCLNHTKNLTNEVPLLLNPCHDDSKEYLEFTLEGLVSPLRDLLKEDAMADPERALRLNRAKESIRVYALNRCGLIYERLEVLRLIEQRKFSITILMEIIGDDLPDHLRYLAQTLIDHEIRVLREFMLPRREFSEMARQVIEAFFLEIDPKNVSTGSN